MHRVLWVGVMAASALLFGACSDSETTDGDGGSGNTSSSDGGSGGSPAGTGGMMGTGGSMQGAGGSAMCLAFGTVCTSSDTCCDVAGETGECFTFGMGPRCTIPCPANPDDCPAGQGCNNQSPAKCKTE